MAIADIGVFGGSGFYEFLDDVEPVTIESEYGEPSATLLVGDVDGRRVAFLPRHGEGHRHPPHRINYRANVDVMRQAGVGAIFGPCASGSLHPDVAPGHFVVVDQFVDRTSGRPDTFWDDGEVDHVSMADPYDQRLRRVAIDACRAEGVTVHETGTVVVIQGPRFSTRAESKWFSREGWRVVNMTQYPEVALANEARIPYASIALITDFDAGLEDDPDVPAVTQDEVFAFFERNVEAVRRVLFRAIAAVPEDLLGR
ncbi:MAG: S-methyl-5'-thioadenosine phosphorylase [Acidimicrobiales bacterium]|nr:S-methyl-5'-thioadenosine phosphorylase [Acidimicrobiales bacterium]